MSLIFVAICVATGYAEDMRYNYLETKVGAMFPWATGFGFRIGETYGFRIDKIVSLNAAFDYYRANYSTGGVQESNSSSGIVTSGLNSDTWANLLKLMANIRLESPWMIGDLVTPYAQFGLGYEMMINNYKTTNQEKTYVFGDFGMELEIGARMKLGEKTSLSLAAAYNICTVTRSKGPNETLIIGEKIDVGGFSVMGAFNYDW